jgi:hypothetical protein
MSTSVFWTETTIELPEVIEAATQTERAVFPHSAFIRSRSWAGRSLTWEKYHQIKARTPCELLQ